MKTLKKLGIISLFIFCITMITACTIEGPTTYEVTFETNGGSLVEVAKVEEGKKVVKPQDPTRNGYEFKGWYEDDQLEHEFSFDTVITENITLFAKWEVKQADREEIRIAGVEHSTNILLYYNHKKEQDNKRTEFMDLNQNYVFGDDNACSVKPNVMFMMVNLDTGAMRPVTVSKWNYELSVYVLEGTTYTLLEENSTFIESMDKEKCTIDFSEEAIGHSFKTVVTPEGLTETQNGHKEDYTISFEFDVVDGYNVYSAKELAYVDNRKEGEDAAAWDAFKVKNNLQTNYYPNQVILHKDIVLTTKDVPELFFYTKEELNSSDSDYDRAVGSMKDYKYFYYHTLGATEKFALLGNYFTIDSSSFKEIVRSNGEITPEGEGMGHSCLFKFGGETTGESSLQNLNFIGNGPRVEDMNKSGSQILVKVEGSKFTAYNNIAACYLIIYFPEYTGAEFFMEKCRVYDAFTSHVYNWGSDKVYINDCEMIGAGGPVICQDHVGSSSADGGRIAKTYVTNSKLQSYVTGTEGWFTLVKASALVPAIKQLDMLFNPFGKSFLLHTNKDQNLTYMNLVCINKSGSAEGVTSERVKGTFQIDDCSTFNYGEDNPYIQGLLDMTFEKGAPAFQTSASDLNSGYAYGTSTGLFDLTSTQIVDPNNAIYQGEYLCLYYSGMAIVLGYNNVGAMID